MQQWLKITGIALLVLLNAALLILLNEKMNDSKVPVDDSDSALTPTTPTPEESPEPAPPGGPQGIAIAGDGTIFRYFAGTCDGKAGPGITASTDGGNTFDQVGLPEGVRSILTLTAQNNDDVQVIGAGENCKPRRHVTIDAGAGWRSVKGVGEWFLHPGTGEVYSPRGKVTSGCTKTVAVGPVSRTRARAFCSSGALLGSADTGRSWVRMGALQGAKTGAFPSANVGYALAPDNRCHTRAFASQNRGITWTAFGCLNAEPGRAMAARGNLVAAIVGDSVYVSKNGGRTWDKK